MVLKKNFHQITFLHIYHHVSIFLIWWFIILAYPFGDCEQLIFFRFLRLKLQPSSPPSSHLAFFLAYFGASQNSFVHVVMYSYYFMSLLKIPVPWKQYITYMQMLQFVMNVVQVSL